MNENYIKEYEEMSLCDFADELVEPLCIIKKDLTKAIYIRYAEERDKNDELEKENTRLKDKIEKAINILNDPWSFESGNKEVDEITYQKKREVIELLKEK